MFTIGTMKGDGTSVNVVEYDDLIAALFGLSLRLLDASRDLAAEGKDDLAHDVGVGSEMLDYLATAAMNGHYTPENLGDGITVYADDEKYWIAPGVCQNPYDIYA